MVNYRVNVNEAFLDEIGANLRIASIQAEIGTKELWNMKQEC
jgi:hypothetical protein